MEKEKDALIVNDSLYINPEDIEEWNTLTEQEREDLADIAPWWSKDYNDGDPLDYHLAVGMSLTGM